MAATNSEYGGKEIKQVNIDVWNNLWISMVESRRKDKMGQIYRVEESSGRNRWQILSKLKKVIILLCFLLILVEFPIF